VVIVDRGIRRDKTVGAVEDGAIWDSAEAQALVEALKGG
jgi:hypothetical protein